MKLLGPAETTAASSEAEPAAMDQAATDTAVLNASLVTIDQLQALTGVNPELAQAIVDGQPYESATAFNDVLMQSLSADEAAQVRERVFVPIDLNSASREDIALVPGMSDGTDTAVLNARARRGNRRRPPYESARVQRCADARPEPIAQVHP